MANAFEGKLFKPGSVIDVSELWPDPGYPENPLLLEFAGSDRTGKGHNRSNHVYVLWRYAPDHGWVELARTFSQSNDWIFNMRSIALRELGPPLPDPEHAKKAISAFLVALDSRLKELSEPDRLIALNLLHENVLARIVGGNTIDP